MLSYWGHALGMVSNHPNNFSPSLWWAIKPSWRAHHCDTAHVYSLHKDVGPKEIDKIESSSHPVNMWPKSIYLGPGLHKNYPGFQLFISDKPRTHVKKAVSGPFSPRAAQAVPGELGGCWSRHSNMLPPCFPPCLGVSPVAEQQTLSVESSFCDKAWSRNETRQKPKTS